MRAASRISPRLASALKFLLSRGSELKACACSVHALRARVACIYAQQALSIDAPCKSEPRSWQTLVRYGSEMCASDPLRCIRSSSALSAYAPHPLLAHKLLIRSLHVLHHVLPAVISACARYIRCSVHALHATGAQRSLHNLYPSPDDSVQVKLTSALGIDAELARADMVAASKRVNEGIL